MDSQPLEICLQSALRRWLDMENLGDHVNLESDATDLQFVALEKLYHPYDRKNAEP
jgi:hypothetical protein